MFECLNEMKFYTVFRKVFKVSNGIRNHCSKSNINIFKNKFNIFLSLGIKSTFKNGRKK